MGIIRSTFVIDADGTIPRAMRNVKPADPRRRRARRARGLTRVPADDVSEFLTRRWRALAEADALFTRPWDDLDPDTARGRLDPNGDLRELEGKDVLCLASGGGQQSVAFALLGARVTVLDISDEQLERDRVTARRHGVAVLLEQGDIRDLGRFGDGSFDLVWQGYSINFVPDPRPVIQGVARVLRAGGGHVFMLANPFAGGVGTRGWRRQRLHDLGALRRGRRA